MPDGAFLLTTNSAPAASTAQWVSCPIECAAAPITVGFVTGTAWGSYAGQALVAELKGAGVLTLGLDAAGRVISTGSIPELDDTYGRFIACRTGFYDPALFQPNREVTFTGRIEAYEERKVGGGYVYKFPRVAADVVYLWPKREQVRVVHSSWPWAWNW